MMEVIEENLQRFSKKLQRFFDMLYDVAVIIGNRNIC